MTGRPSAEDVECVQSQFASTMLDNLACNVVDVADWFPDASPEAHDLMRRSGSPFKCPVQGHALSGHLLWLAVTVFMELAAAACHNR